MKLTVYLLSALQRSREKGYGDESEAAHGGIISASEAIQSDAPLTTVSMVAVDFGEGPALRSSFGNHRRRLASSEVRL